MTKKADFNAEQWEAVVEGPVLAGLAVVAADRGGTIRESLAMGRVYTEARKEHGESELLDELVSSQPSVDRQKAQAGGGDIAALAKQRLSDAMRILEEKATPEEVDAYKRFVMTV